MTYIIIDVKKMNFNSWKQPDFVSSHGEIENQYFKFHLLFKGGIKMKLFIIIRFSPQKKSKVKLFCEDKKNVIGTGIFLSPWIWIRNPEPEDPWIRVRIRIRNTVKHCTVADTIRCRCFDVHISSLVQATPLWSVALERGVFLDAGDTILLS